MGSLPWLIRKFIDPQAQFLVVPADQVMAVPKPAGARPNNVERGLFAAQCLWLTGATQPGLVRTGADYDAVHNRQGLRVPCGDLIIRHDLTIRHNLTIRYSAKLTPGYRQSVERMKKATARDRDQILSSIAN